MSHERQGAGKSERSWVKHDFVERIAGSYTGAFRIRHPNDRALLIDANAGDGEGVPRAQADLFEGERLSAATPTIMTNLARRMGGADVCLCDIDKRKRAILMHRFPQAIVLKSHAEIIRLLPGYRYALWLSDPCGPKGHGIDYMAQVAQVAPMSDFIILFNEGAVKRLNGTPAGCCWDTSRELYGPMIEPAWWLERLRKKYLVRSRPIQQSHGFRYRLLVISDFLADQTRRPPFAEIIKAEDIATPTASGIVRRTGNEHRI